MVGPDAQALSSSNSSNAPQIAAHESVCGPIGRQARDDPDRFQKISRRHLTNTGIKKNATRRIRRK